MKNEIVFILLIALTNCTGQTTQLQHDDNHVESKSNGYRWTRVLEEAPWAKSYNFQMFQIHDTLWTFHSEGNWYSTDGMSWTKSRLTNSIYNLGFLDYVAFNNAIYGLGHFEGNIETFDYRSEIYRTNNFINWTTLSKENNLPQRFFYHPFVFDNRIWIIGGEDKTKQYADIWNSSDGVKWTKKKDNLEFGKRSNSQVVWLKNRLFLLNNDVWSSSDGVNWQKETDEIIKGQTIFGYAAVVFDGKIWLLGCNRNGQFSSQVLVSENGKTWNVIDAPWTPRGGIAATVYKNKIYMTGGKYGGTSTQPEFIYSNDVWTLERKE
jgi:hypothetical protein